MRSRRRVQTLQTLKNERPGDRHAVLLSPEGLIPLIKQVDDSPDSIESLGYEVSL